MFYPLRSGGSSAPSLAQLDELAQGGAGGGEEVLQDEAALKPGALFSNFLVFSVLYGITHATVDGVLAFSTAELGASVGSEGSSLLYFFYTFSALLLAKPAVRHLGAQRAVLAGLMGLLFYVTGFLTALYGGDGFYFVGACIGGIGAGLLWTGQGSYYSINARAYAFSAGDADSSAALATCASFFAAIYLLIETCFKLFATAMYLAKDKSSDWRPVVFGLYVAAALIAVVSFPIFVKDLAPSAGQQQQQQHLQVPPSVRAGTILVEVHREENALRSESADQEQREAELGSTPTSSFFPWRDVSSVARALWSNRQLQLLMPYQVCFGLSSGFVSAYVTAKVVSPYLGDGYIGLMSALSTLTAFSLAWPYARLATWYQHRGRWAVMMLGAACFLYTGLSVLCLSDEQMASWPFLVSYFCFYGAARGTWESINKAVVAEYFGFDDRLKDSAFAAVYFTSGLSGSCGYLFYKFMSREVLASINTIVPLVAGYCFHLSHLRHLAALPPSQDGAEPSQHRGLTSSMSIH